ncbi:MAG: hypothetical protein HQM07_03515 [Zetaproteobacteria bacterium]|nr:hypothetical protein [Zetaproteobacteria bacterium]
MRGLLLLLLLMVSPATIWGDGGESTLAPAQVYRHAMQLAAADRLNESLASLHAAAAMLPQQHPWRERMECAASLLQMRKSQAFLLEGLHEQSHYTTLIRQFMQQHPQPEAASTTIPTLLAIILPGAGHAWLGRWHDALIAVLMVWPMLILTLWAIRRDMGPVSIFFTMMTTWLWSGTAFSAISLAKRGNLEGYMQWWQQLWLSSGLTGVTPW